MPRPKQPVGQAETAYVGPTVMLLGGSKLWFEPRRHGSDDGGGRNAIDRKDGVREKGRKSDGNQG